MGDGLISSRADNAENKSLSNRKTGKEGHVVDYVACSFTSVVYILRSRVTVETREDNIKELIITLPTLTSTNDKTMLLFDKVTGKFRLLRHIQNKVHIIRITTTVESINTVIPIRKSTAAFRNIELRKILMSKSKRRFAYTRIVMLVDPTC